MERGSEQGREGREGEKVSQWGGGDVEMTIKRRFRQGRMDVSLGHDGGEGWAEGGGISGVLASRIKRAVTSQTMIRILAFPHVSAYMPIIHYLSY